MPIDKLSDTSVLPTLIDETWELYNSAQEPEKGQLAGKLQGLHEELVKLTDSTLDPTQQAYKDAVNKVQQATKAVTEAQSDQKKVASAIGQLSSVIGALVNLASV
jgi:septation ring formation regulator EzrA